MVGSLISVADINASMESELGNHIWCGVGIPNFIMAR